MRPDEAGEAPPPFRRRSWANTAGVATALATLLFWTEPLLDAALRGAPHGRVSRRGVVEFVVLCAFLTLLFRTRSVPPRPWGDRDGDAILVRVSPARRLAWSGLVLAFALAPLLALRVEHGVDAQTLVGLAAAVVAALALADRFFGRTVRLRRDGIEAASTWTGRRRLLRWEAITSISGDGIGGAIRIRAGHGLAVEVLLVCDGLGDLAAMALALAPPRATRASAGIHEVLRAWSEELLRDPERGTG
jgi:hypothetical protein